MNRLSHYPALLVLLVLVSGCGILPFGESSDQDERVAPAPPVVAIPAPPSTDSLLSDIPVAGFPSYHTAWVDSVLATLSLRERIAQLVVPFSFAEVTPKTLARLHEDVAVHGCGGVILSRGSVEDARALIDSLHGWARVPLLIAADFENGPGMRLQGALELPSMMAIGATRSTDLAYRAGRAIADESLDIGVNMNFAPVADVNSNPENPIINTRSFGEQRELVADMSEALLRGMQDGGLIATAKHFPGHGDTDTDSHTGLPLLPVSLERLDSLELYPFRQLIDAGTMAVMTAHVAVPALTGDSTLPATLSGVLLDSLLRRDMGFRGLIVTDALNMKALTRTRVTNIPASALHAGADVLLLPADAGVTIDSVQAAVTRGELDSARLVRSVRRVLGFKQWAHARRTVTDSVLTRLDRRARNRRLSERIADQSVTLLRSVDGVLPIGCEGRRLGIMHFVRRSLPASGDLLAQGIERRGADVRETTITRKSRSRDVRRWMRDSLAQADALILASWIAVSNGSGSIGVSEDQRDIIGAAAELDIPVILLSMGSPYILSEGSGIPVLAAVYSDAPASVQAAVRLLTGEINGGGRLPVRIPGMFAYGDGGIRVESAACTRVDTLIREQIERGAFPGAQLAVARPDTVLFTRSYGRQTYDSASSPIDTRTMYDIASLTKVVGTTLAAMKLYEEGRLHLDSSVASYLPEFGVSGKEEVTIRQLLTHRSGLKPYRLFYLMTDSAESVLDSIYGAPPAYPPGSRTAYSDLGMITLAKVIERITGMSIDNYLNEEFYQPLGMERTMFRPPDSLRGQTAPTEIDTVWRGRLVQGEVHDETAAILGGVAGHAGLFSTAHDLARFVRMLLNGGEFEGRQYLRPSTIAMFTTRQSNTSTRALGWDTRSVSGSSSGHYFSMKSYGHLGFTGTSIWIDPVEKLGVIFLTNRVHPTRRNKQLSRFRSVLHDAVREALQGLDAIDAP